MTIGYLWSNAWMTLLRMLPVRFSVGVVRVGNPDRQSPVLLTGNYKLTVIRVLRALRGVNAWLLVANSRGVNVWCAATGGLLSDHEVVSVLKTSGVEACVDHRNVILPQLAATGIYAESITEKTGWTVLWGPVEAEDLPDYLAADCLKTRATRTVGFPWYRRVEMALAWAFPMSLLAIPLFFWLDSGLLLLVLIWVLPHTVFLGFPLFQGKGGVLDSSWSIVLTIWAMSVLCFAVSGWVAGVGYSDILVWTMLSLGVLLILGLDLKGSTSTQTSKLHSPLHIRLDVNQCAGIGACENVCPKEVFIVEQAASFAHADACVQCGACIVQCPCDALSFEDSRGGTVAPSTIRRFKLNLLGRRSVDTH